MLRPSGYPAQLDTLGDHLRAARLDRRLKQVEAADQLGVSEGTIVHWELGHFSPDLRAIPKVIAWLGYDPRESGATLAQQIRWVRRARGLSQEEFARLLGADPSSVSHWENGDTTPSPRYREILEALIAEMRGVVLNEAA